MSARTATLALWGLGFQLGVVAAQSPVATTPTVARLRVYSLRAEALEQARQLLATGDTALRPAYERLVRKGVEFYNPPFSPSPGVRIAEFYDSEGNRLSLSSDR